MTGAGVGQFAIHAVDGAITERHKFVAGKVVGEKI